MKKSLESREHIQRRSSSAPLKPQTRLLRCEVMKQLWKGKDFHGLLALLALTELLIARTLVLLLTGSSPSRAGGLVTPVTPATTVDGGTMCSSMREESPCLHFLRLRP